MELEPVFIADTESGKTLGKTLNFVSYQNGGLKRLLGTADRYQGKFCPCHSLKSIIRTEL